MFVTSSATALPWDAFGSSTSRHARIIAAIDRHADRLLAIRPTVPVPETGLMGLVKSGPFTVRGLINLWRQVPLSSHDPCPRCRSAARAIGLSQGHSRSGFVGVCLGCAAALRREVTSPGGVIAAVPESIRNDTARLPHVWMLGNPGPGQRPFTVGDTTVLSGDRAKFETEEAQERIATLRWEPLLDALRGLGVRV